MKLSDNMVLIICAFLNILKDIFAIGMFGYLAWYFNNIWIVLFACLFMGGGIKVSMKSKNEKGEDEDGE